MRMFVTRCWSFLAFLTIAGSSSSTSTTSLESSSLAKRNSSLKETFVQYNANCRWQRPLLLFCRQLVSCSHSVQCRSQQHSARHKMNTILHNAPLHCQCSHPIQCSENTILHNVFHSEEKLGFGNRFLQLCQNWRSWRRGQFDSMKWITQSALAPHFHLLYLITVQNSAQGGMGRVKLSSFAVIHLLFVGKHKHNHHLPYYYSIAPGWV